MAAAAVTPPLKLRKDVWTYFPVNMDAMGRGANGADRYGIEWHNMKVRAAATAAGMTPDAYKQAIFPKMMRALMASRAWTVEAPPPGSRFIAVLAMRFAAPAATAALTRKSKSPTPTKKSKSPTRKSASPNKPKSKSHTPTRKSKSPNKSKSPTRKSPASNLKRARALMNLMSETTVDKLSREFASLVPRDTYSTEYRAFMQLIVDTMLDTQAYHPLIIQLLRVLGAAAVAVVGDLLLARLATEPRYVLFDIHAEEGELEMTNAVEEDIQRQKRFYRSGLLFLGYMYREQMVTYSAALEPVLSKLLTAAKGEEDYRLQDAAIQGLLFVLIRAGRRMEAEGGAAAAHLESLKTEIRGLSESVRRGAIRSLCLDFLEAAAEGYKIKEDKPWAVGAPKGDIQMRGAPAAAALAPEGLGSDIGELWRRFPLDVKQEGNMWVIRIHMKKLGERFARESGRYRTKVDLEYALIKQIFSLIDNSRFWRRGPLMSGTLVTVVAK